MGQLYFLLMRQERLHFTLGLIHRWSPPQTRGRVCGWAPWEEDRVQRYEEELLWSPWSLGTAALVVRGGVLIFNPRCGRAHVYTHVCLHAGPIRPGLSIPQPRTIGNWREIPPVEPPEATAFPPAVSLAVTQSCHASQKPYSVLRTRGTSKQYLHLYFRGTSQTYSRSPHFLLIQVFGETKKEKCILSNPPGHVAAALPLQIYRWTSWGWRPARDKIQGVSCSRWGRWGCSRWWLVTA